MGEFDGLVAVITGGGSGIGAATAERLISAGARVGALDLNPPADSASIRGVKADVADSASLDAAMAAVADAFGGIDILINSAGISAVGDVSANDDGEWARVLDVNVTGVARASRAALPYLPAVLTRGDREPVVDRGDRRAGAARALLGIQGRGARAHPGDGRRPGRRRRPGVLRGPRHGGHARGSPGCWPAPTIRPPRRRSSPPGNPLVAWSPPMKWRPRSHIWQVRSPELPPACRSRSTAACPDSGCRVCR